LLADFFFYGKFKNCVYYFISSRNTLKLNLSASYNFFFL
jgi:hypothetical protein